MRIQRFEIRNFRSLREVILDDLGDLVAIIGRNGSGKTCVIEALGHFFHEFDAALETPVSITDNSLWYCFETGRPIEFRVALDLSDDEQEAVAPPRLLEMWRSGGDSHRLTLSRHIERTPQGAVWRTIAVRLGDEYLIEDGKPTPQAEQQEVETPPVEPSPVTPPDGVPDGDQVDQVEAQHPEQPTEPPNPGQLSDDVQRLLTNLSQRLRETLRVIPAVRSTPGSPETGFGKRQPFISGEMQKQLVELHNNTSDTVAAAKFSNIQTLLEDELGARWRLDFVADEPYLDEAGQRIPIWLTGGGHQEYLAFVQRLLEEDRIFAIEEPESHLHYTLCKALFRLMHDIAKERQIILVTHSEHFLDFEHPTTNWIFEKDGKETKAVRAKATDQLRLAISGIGGEPADRLFPNTLLLVAGQTEEAVVPIWLEKMEIKTGLGGVEVSAFQGESDWRKAAARIEAYKDTQTRLFLMVDDHGTPLALKAQALGLPEDHCLKLDGTIEDCYPSDKLSEAMVRIYGAENMRDVESDFDEEAPRVEDIQTILKKRLKMPSKKHTGWKIPLGTEVAKRMSVDQIPAKVKDFLEKLGESNLAAELRRHRPAPTRTQSGDTTS